MVKVYCRHDMVVVGCNEDGQVYGPRFNLIAEWESGTRLSHNHGIMDEAEAHKFADKVDRFVANGGELDWRFWSKTSPRYGSPSHEMCGDSHLMEESEIIHVGHNRCP